MGISVILDLGTTRIAVRKSNFKTIEFDWTGSVHSFSLTNDPTKTYVRTTRNSIYFGFLELVNFGKQKTKYDNNKFVTNTDWRIGEFVNFNILAPAENGDVLEGAFPTYSSTTTAVGKCQQLFHFSYTGIVPSASSFYTDGAPDNTTPLFGCDSFGAGTQAYGFFNAFKDETFTEGGVSSKDVKLIGEIASLLKSAGDETSKAFDQFVIDGAKNNIVVDHFNFTSDGGNYSRTDFLNYKKGLEIWLNILKEQKDKLKQLTSDQQMFMVVDVMYRYNMLVDLTVTQRINLLKVMVKGSLISWYFSSIQYGFQDRELLALKLVESVPDNQAAQFLDGLLETIKDVRNIRGNVITLECTIYKALFYQIDDFFGSANFTAFACAINRLVLAKNGITQSTTPISIQSPDDIKNLVKYVFIWNKKGYKDFKGKVDYSISYPTSSTIKVHEKVCTEIEYRYPIGGPYARPPAVPTVVGFKESDVVLNHFDLVSVALLSNPSFLDLCQYAGCVNGTFLASAGYIDYLLEKQDTKFTIDVLSTSVQVLFLAFGVGELLVAIRAADIVRGIVGAYIVIGDFYALVINSQGFKDYLYEAYPDDAQGILNNLEMISIINSATSGVVTTWYSAYKINQACGFIGYVESLSANPGAMKSLNTAEVNALQATRERLLAEMYILRKNANTDYLIENSIRTYRDKLNLGIVNSRRGYQVEFDDAANIIKQYRNLTGDTQGNFGFLEYNGTQFENKIWRSGAATSTEPQIFTAINATGRKGTWLRVTDSEYKMLNKFANYYYVEGTASYPNVTGTLKVVSENIYCISCEGVLQQFNKMFPNVNLILIDNVVK